MSENIVITGAARTPGQPGRGAAVFCRLYHVAQLSATVCNILVAACGPDAEGESRDKWKLNSG